MSKLMFTVGLCLCLAQTVTAQDGFKLAPGEKLLAINGVPVGSSGNQVTYSNSVVGPVRQAGHVQQAQYAQPINSGSTIQRVSGSSVPVQAYSSVPSNHTTRGGTPAVIGEGTAAYQHALREAQIIASRGGNYHRQGDGGHPLGTAPGCSYSGTGYTWDPNRPGHCFLGELPDSRIVARARVQGANGAWFWSAHYR